jgi:hypothetical protein
MQFDFNSLMNYGALGVCLAYFIYKDNTTMKDLRDTVQGLKETVLVLKEKFEKEDK